MPKAAMSLKFKTPSGIIGNPMTYVGPDESNMSPFLRHGGWSGIGIAGGIGPEDPTAGLERSALLVTSINSTWWVLTVFCSHEARRERCMKKSLILKLKNFLILIYFRYSFHPSRLVRLMTKDDMCGCMDRSFW
jgi:hypothetical protein